jgi:hypothetical protein
MLAVDFESEIITSKNFPNRFFLPILDTSANINDLINRLSELKEKYKIKNIFLAGDSIVGSCANIGDYVCLCAEIEMKENTNLGLKSDIRMIKSSELTEDLKMLFNECDIQSLQSKDVGVVEVSNGENPSTIYVINYQL